jgi:hypothetical protein
MTEIACSRPSTPPSSKSVDMTTTVVSSTSPPALIPFRKLSEMWHPHVYGMPPKSPTHFSIDDILKRNNTIGRTMSAGVYGNGEFSPSSRMVVSPPGSNEGSYSVRGEEDDGGDDGDDDEDDGDVQPLNLTTTKKSGMNGGRKVQKVQKYQKVQKVTVNC